MPRAHQTPGRSTRDRPAKPPLSGRAVVDAAMTVLAAEGIRAVTMRRVAKELDTGAASLYAYVRNREELHERVFDRVCAEIPRCDIEPGRWRDQLRQLLIDSRDALARYPGVAAVALEGVPTGDESLAVADTMLGLLLAAGLDPQRAAWASDALFLFLTAAAIENDLRDAASGGRPLELDAIEQRFRELPAGTHPHIAAHVVPLVTGDADTRFRFAVDTFIAGLAAEA